MDVGVGESCYVNKIKFSTANEMRIGIHNNYTTLNSTPFLVSARNCMHEDAFKREKKWRVVDIQGKKVDSSRISEFISSLKLFSCSTQTWIFFFNVYEIHLLQQKGKSEAKTRYRLMVRRMKLNRRFIARCQLLLRQLCISISLTHPPSLFLEYQALL